MSLDPLPSPNYTGANLAARVDATVALLRGGVSVDSHGAVGDCPLTGSTAGATDDSDAIEAALTACVDGGIVRFTPGKCYMVSRLIDITGNSMTVDIRGATIRCGDDTVWHPIKIGGVDADTPVDFVTVLGGTLDGNRANQRYWPNTDGTTIFTDAGEEAIGSYAGTPFYENSPINGTTWDNGWLGGTAGDGINVLGSGNDGMIQIKYAERAVFERVRVKDYIRNGLVAWSCRNATFLHCDGSGGLPFHLFELQEHFTGLYEAAFIKTAGLNADNLALRGNFTAKTHIIGGSCEGGHMPIFIRTNTPKPESALNETIIDGFTANGFSRDVWFEVSSRVRMKNCSIVGDYHLDSVYRKSPGIFFGNGTIDWSIRDSLIVGPVNTNQYQQRRTSILDNVILESELATGDLLAECAKMVNCRVRTKGNYVLAEEVTNSTFLVEGQSTAMQATHVTSCRIGRKEYQGTTETFAMSAEQTEVTLNSDATHITRIRRRNTGIWGGREWVTLHASDYAFEAPTVTFTGEAQTGDVVEVEWHEQRTDDLVATEAQANFDLTETGAHRVEDVVSVKLETVAVPHKSTLTVADQATDPHWTMARQSGGLTRITLVNATVVADDAVQVIYWPARKVWGSISTIQNGGDSSIIGGILEGTTFVRVQTNSRLLFSGRALNAEADILFQPGADTSLTIRGADIRGARGCIVAPANLNTVVREIVIDSSAIENWGIGGAALSSTNYLRLIGANNGSGTYVSDFFQMTDNTLAKTDRNPGSASGGTIRGSECKRVLIGANAIFGSVAFSSLNGVTKITKADAA